MNDNSYLFEISQYLAVFTGHTKLENSAGKFDINKQAESFLIPLLNQVFGKKFSRTEILKVNYAAVDLISDDGKLCIQVTSQKGLAKIKNTLVKYIETRQFENSELIHLVIDETFESNIKEKELQNFIEEEVKKLKSPPAAKVKFTRESIWNMADLRIQIERNCKSDQLGQIREFLRSQYGNVTGLPGFREILIPYDVYYYDKLQQDSLIQPFRFSNPFFGRTKEMDDLTATLQKPQTKMVAVVADGGLGKTRFCIEFFKKVIDPKNDTDCFVFNESAFSGQIFPGRLAPGRKVLILVDDAHRKAGSLEGLFASARQYDNVQILLTIRKPLLQDTLENLSTQDREISKIPLKRFGYDDTITLIGNQLPLEKKVKHQIAETSKGVPFIIISLCSLMAQGKYSSSISGEENFTSFVRELKKQVIDDVSQVTFIEPKKINKVIELVGLLAPLANTHEELTLLATLAAVEYEECIQILNGLVEYDFVSRKNTVSIVADPYADVIIAGMGTQVNFVLGKSEAAKFKDRIIRNLVGIDQLDGLKLDINSIITEFINSIGSNALTDMADVRQLENNLDTLKYFTYKKPLFGIAAIRTLLHATEKNENFWQVKDNWSQFKTAQDSIATIFGLIALGVHSDSEFEELLGLVSECSKRRGDLVLFQRAFRYRVYDFQENGYNVKPCERQQFLVKKLTAIAKKKDITEFEQELVQTGCNLLLNLEYSAEEWFNHRTHEFSFGTGKVIDNNTTQLIRTEAIQIMFELYRRTRHTEFSEKIYADILRSLFFMVILDRKNEYQLDQSSQVHSTAKFLDGLMNDKPSIAERSKLIYQLQLFERRNIKPEFKTLRTLLLASASVANSDKEKIELLLRRDYLFKRDNFKTEFSKIRTNYVDQTAFFEDLIVIRRGMNKDANNFYEAIQFIINTPDEAKTMYVYVSKNHADMSVPFSNLIAANHTDSKYFYEQIERLWGVGTEEAKSAVIFLLTIGRNRNTSLFRDVDFKYIDTVIKEKNFSAMSNLSITLPDFMALDVDTTLHLCAEFLKHESRNFNDEMLIGSLFEEKAKLYPEKLRTFAFKHTASLGINSIYRHHILMFLENQFGFEIMFRYFLKYIEDTEREIGLHAIDLHSGTYVNPILSQDQREDNLLKAIEWYCSLQEPVESQDEKIVAYFAPHDIFQKSFVEKINQFIASHKGDLKMLLKISRALDFLNRENDNVLIFLIELANKLAKLEGCTHENIEDVFDRNFIWNYESRSGYGPGPFLQDVEKNKRLNEIMQKSAMEPQVKLVFEIALDRTKIAIERRQTTDASSDGW